MIRHISLFCYSMDSPRTRRADPGVVGPAPGGVGPDPGGVGQDPVGVGPDLNSTLENNFIRFQQERLFQIRIQPSKNIRIRSRQPDLNPQACQGQNDTYTRGTRKNIEIGHELWPSIQGFYLKCSHIFFFYGIL